MKHFLFFFATMCSIGMLMASPQPNIQYVIWAGEDTTDVVYWTNAGDNMSELASKVAVPASNENGLYNSSAFCLAMQRSAAEAWHGVGFNLEPLAKHPADANHFYLLVKKSAAGPVKLEMQIDDGAGGYVQAWSSADYTDVGRWQALTFAMWEDSVFNANPNGLIKTIYLHTHDADASQGEPVDIMLDAFTAGYDMWNMPVDIHCYSGWNDINGYNNIRTLNAWNDAEVGATEKKVKTLRYIRSGVTNAWVSMGLPNCLSTPNNIHASVSEVYDSIVSSDGIVWENTHADSALYSLPYLANSVEDTIVMEWSDVVLNYHPEVAVVEGWQLVSNPVMQLFNAGFLVNDSTQTSVYLLEDDRFNRIDSGEHYITSMTSFLIYQGDNAPESVVCGNSSTGVSDVVADKANTATMYMRNGQVFIQHKNKTYNVLGNQIY